MIPLAEDDVRYNAGTRCDVLTGPCACGAWHFMECPECGRRFDAPTVHCPSGVEAVRV